ncbi:MAG: NAD-dependent epimerase/dehydratase family protein [Congregibacter sp.]
MRIVITGATGYIGGALVEALAREGLHEVVAVDSAPCPESRATHQCVGDLCAPEFVAEVFEQPCDALVHLATLPGGAAEQNRSLAQRVNVDASLALLDAARIGAKCPRVIFASSIAAYGDLSKGPITDDTPLRPQMIYGGQKAMLETWIETLTRRGDVNGVSLRLPGIVARPREPSGMKSAFLSDLFHAAKAGEQFTSPVSPTATMWLMSRPCAVENLLHALSVNVSESPVSRLLTLSNIRVSMEELVAGVVDHADCSEEFVVNYAPDEELEAVFGTQAQHDLRQASALGFIDDGDTIQLIENAFSCI